MSSTSDPMIRQPAQWLRRADDAVTAWMANNGILLLRMSLGVVFLWFGALKFFPNLSPAADLAQRTIETITFGLVPPGVSIYILAVWECLIGLGLLAGIWLRATLALLWLQMLGAIMPVFLFPEVVFVQPPFALTLEGQYIVKNLVIISASLVIGATLSESRIRPGVPQPANKHGNAAIREPHSHGKNGGGASPQPEEP